MVTLLLLTLVLRADGLPPQTTAAIEHDTAKATAEVQEKYGNRKPAELSPEERRQLGRDQADAERKVLEKHGVSEKEWASSGSRRSRDDREAIKAAREGLVEKDKADAAAAEKAKAEANKPKEVVVQRGISEQNPVTLDEAAGAAPVVERGGLPADFQSDQEAATQAGGAAEKNAPPERPKKRGR
jgi:hypothetical protein